MLVLVSEVIFYFNPRSLTGATLMPLLCQNIHRISIHAPSRERPGRIKKVQLEKIFQSTLPHGSDHLLFLANRPYLIFQSTLPHGSDSLRRVRAQRMAYFNPRSLTGATLPFRLTLLAIQHISIHAPSRERQGFASQSQHSPDFNPRSLTGATTSIGRLLLI